jgi:hypothetical protein
MSAYRPSGARRARHENRLFHRTQLSRIENVLGTTAAAQPNSFASEGDEFPHMRQLLENIAKWIGKNLTASSDFQQFTRKKLGMIFVGDDDVDTTVLPDFVLPAGIAQEHALLWHTYNYTYLTRRCHNVSIIFGDSLFSDFPSLGMSILKTCANFISRCFI